MQKAKIPQYVIFNADTQAYAVDQTGQDWDHRFRFAAQMDRVEASIVVIKRQAFQRKQEQLHVLPVEEAEERVGH